LKILTRILETYHFVNSFISYFKQKVLYKVIIYHDRKMSWEHAALDVQFQKISFIMFDLPLLGAPVKFRIVRVQGPGKTIRDPEFAGTETNQPIGCAFFF
jgi:hypothetical protein